YGSSLPPNWTFLADALEGARSLGAVCPASISCVNGCEGPQPSRSVPIIVSTNDWTFLADALEGARSVGAVIPVPISAVNSREGPHFRSTTPPSIRTLILGIALENSRLRFAAN